MALINPIRVIQLCDPEKRSTLTEISNHLDSKEFPLLKSTVCSRDSSMTVSTYEDGSLVFEKTILKDKDNHHDLDYTIVKRRLKILENGEGEILESRTFMQKGRTHSEPAKSVANDLRFDRNEVSGVFDLLRKRLNKK